MHTNLHIIQHIYIYIYIYTQHIYIKIIENDSKWHIHIEYHITFSFPTGTAQAQEAPLGRPNAVALNARHAPAAPPAEIRLEKASGNELWQAKKKWNILHP